MSIMSESSREEMTVLIVLIVMMAVMIMNVEDEQKKGRVCRSVLTRGLNAPEVVAKMRKKENGVRGGGAWCKEQDS
jgi:hypothetical protein